MDDAATFYLMFDVTSGPQIVKSIGDISFSDDELLSLKSCAFPDTVVQSITESILFVFKIRKYYCYSIFTTTPDATVSRGHRQFSFVIATTLPYVYPFTRILHSAMSLFYMDPIDILLLLSDFVTKSLSLFPTEIGDDKEIPTFDGGLAVGIAGSSSDLLDFVGGIGWTPQCKKYLINTSFLGIDIVSSLSVQQLIVNGRSGDVLRLWEAVMMDESIMVYGSNPTITSSASLAIASLIYPEQTPVNLFPFISVTDPRFQMLTNNNNNNSNSNVCNNNNNNNGNSENAKGTIAGFSNPISIQRSSKFDLVFSTGFKNPEENGFINNISKSNWNSLSSMKPITNSNIRHLIYLNTVKVHEAVVLCLQKLRATNPYAEFVAQIDANDLTCHLLQQGVQMNIPAKKFSAKLIHSTFFNRIWQERCTFDSLLDELKHFLVDSLCAGRIEHELIDIYSTVKNVRRKCSGNKNLEEIIDADLTTITLYLSPDIILAPAMQ